MSVRSLRRLVVSLVAVPLLAYPVAVIAQGAPAFPSPAECVRIADPGETAELDLVWGRFETPYAADQELARVTGAGFVGAETRRDDCGRWKVVYDGITDYANGAAVVEEARKVGFDPRLEIAPG